MLKDKKCENCPFKWRDCKLCYIRENNFIDVVEETYIPNILFTIVLTRRCNYRCEYCAMKFENKDILKNVVDKFIDILKKFRKQIWSLKLEFFWWEPLMRFDVIKYMVDNSNWYNIWYTVVTNWEFLDEEKINFMERNNFEVVFSVSYKTFKLLNKKINFFKRINKKNIIINFILEPRFVDKLFDLFKFLIELWFRKITILPVYYTKTWNKEQFVLLEHLLIKIKKFYRIFNKINKDEPLEIFYVRTNKEFEYNIPKEDLEFILDRNGNIYADYETELYLLNDFVPDKVYSLKDLYLGNILDDKFSFIDVILKRRKFDIMGIMKKIVNYLGIKDNLIELWRIMKKYNVNVESNIELN